MRESKRLGRLAAPVVLLVVLAVVLWHQLQPRPENVILICLDTVRYDTFNLPVQAGFGDPFQPWESRAIHFARAYAAAPWTIPSVASVMTGLYPSQHGAGRFKRREADLDRQLPSGLPEGAITMAEMLSARGYRTVSFSSHPWMIDDAYKLLQGIDGKHLANRDAIIPAVNGWIERTGRQRSHQPFFLNLHLMDAHDLHTEPHTAFPDYLTQLSPDFKQAALQAHPVDLKEESIIDRYLVYVLSVLQVRERLAELFEKLEETGLLDRSIVVLYSDHGEEFHDRLQEGSDEVDVRGQRGVGHGHSLFGEMLHVPFLIWLPDREAVRVEAPVSLIDVLPTLARRLGIEKPKQAPLLGRDLNPLMGGDQPVGGWSKRPLFASGIGYGFEQFALMVGESKAVLGPEKDRLRFYDLKGDALERNPLDDRPDAERLILLLKRYVALTAPRGPLPQLTREQIEALQSIGYLGAVE